MLSVSALLLALPGALGGCGPADPEPATAADSAQAPGPRQGKWVEDRRGADGELTDEQRARIRELEAIGYAEGVEAAGLEVGVVRHDAARAQAGANLFVSGHAPEARLVDMDGTTLHLWTCDVEASWPDLDRSDGAGEFFERARLLPDGELFALLVKVGLVRLDADSKVLWTYRAVVHHDVDVLPDGGALVLEREAYLVPWINPERPVLDDFVTWLDAEGRVRERLSLLECIDASPLREELRAQITRQYAEELEDERRGRERYAHAIAQNPEKDVGFNPAGDLFHSNSVQHLDGSLAHLAPHLAEGNVLISVRQLSRVLVLDPGARRVVWSLEGAFERQHMARLNPDGGLTLFDNLGPRAEGLAEHSRVLEYDPSTEEVLWSYMAAEAGAFYSTFNGSCQRLSGGNTLITESTHGRAFEVTPAGEIVWEFHSPFRSGDEGQFVAVLPDLVRVAPLGPGSWLER